MDTRRKILAAEEAVEHWSGRKVRLVRGYFDPLLAEHARRLAELATPGAALVVVIEDPPQPILPARARAELVAALQAVDCVVLGAPTNLPAEAVFDETWEDLGRAEKFMAEVRARQGV